MKDIAIVIGHTQKSKGACSTHNIPCEWDFNSKVAGFLKDVVDIYTYDSYTSGYTTMVKKNAAKLNKGNYKLVIELHYNAASVEANGCETLYYFNNKKGKYLAEQSSMLISSVFKVKNRGARALVNDKDRGFAAVFYPNATTILLEPFFGSNKGDSDKFRDKEKEYAEVIKRIIKLV